MIPRTDVEKKIPSGGEGYDVIVAGGGPAGMGAALGAAMNGAKTLLLEEKSFFGGVASVADTATCRAKENMAVCAGTGKCYVCQSNIFGQSFVVS